MQEKSSITVMLAPAFLCVFLCAETAQAAPPSGRALTPQPAASVACTTCSGTSSVVCKYCQGNDRTKEACRHCNGTGSIKTDCWHCKGRDLTKDRCRFCRGKNLANQPCPNCRGKDLTKQVCTLCLGKDIYGRKRCAGCNGSGKKRVCALCKGVGKAPACVYCKGSGKQSPCISCKGASRSKTCLHCSGTGKKPPCAACKGAGKLPCPKCAARKSPAVGEQPKPPKDPDDKKVVKKTDDDKKAESDEMFDPSGHRHNESVRKTLRDRLKRSNLANIRIPPYYYIGQEVENGSYSDQFFRRTGYPGTVYIHGYYRRNGTYVRSHYRSNASMMFTSRPPAVSTYGGAKGNLGYYGQTSPTAQRRRALNVRGYYRTWTLPRWHVRTSRFP